MGKAQSPEEVRQGSGWEKWPGAHPQARQGGREAGAEGVEWGFLLLACLRRRLSTARACLEVKAEHLARLRVGDPWPCACWEEGCGPCAARGDPWVIPPEVACARTLPVRS